MMSAKGIKVAIKSEYAGDIAVIEEVFEEYRNRNYFDPSDDSAEIIPTTNIDSVDNYDIALDLSNEGSLELKTPVGDTTILYSEEDRKPLIKQLILMFSGNRIIDADISEIMAVLGEHCRAISKYWGYTKEEYRNLENDDYFNLWEKINSIIADAIADKDPSEMDIFIQIKGDDPMVMCQMVLDCDFRNVIWQIIDTEETYIEDDERIVTVFMGE